MGEEQLARARASQALVFDAVMRAITDIHPMPEEGEGAGGIDFFPTMDGLLQVIGTMAVLVGAFPTSRDKREFSEHMRKGLVKHIADAERAAANGNFWESRRLDRMP